MISKIFNLKPFLDRHKGWKVAAMASIFKALFVKNLAAIIYSIVAKSDLIWNLGPSRWERESPFHYFVSSSMEVKYSVSQKPKKKKPNKP